MGVHHQAMKLHLPLFLLLAIPVLSISALASSPNIKGWTVVDVNQPEDIVTFLGNGTFTVSPLSSNQIIAQGLYRQDGTGLSMTLYDGNSFGPKPYTSYVGSGDFSFVNQIFTNLGDTPAFATNGEPIVPSGPLIVGGATNYNATVTDNGNGIFIESDGTVDFTSLLHGSGGSIILGIDTGGNNNQGNGNGSPSDPPPGGGTSTTPEPSTWALLICSLAGLILFNRFRLRRR
jgi:hypothetical protein